MKPHLHDSVEPILKWLDQHRPWMEDRLLELICINSGTHNPVGINRVGEYYAALFAERLEAAIDKFSLDPWQRITMLGHLEEQELGCLWRIRKRPDAPIQVLLCGHLDTVFGQESGFQKSTYQDRDTLNGPGAADMKGGILVMLSALEALEQHPDHHNVGWTVLLNPDEEIGSPGSAGWFAREAHRHHLGMVYEPALPDGNLAGSRKGSGNFTLTLVGQSAHAGRNPEDGRNAINAAAHAIKLLEQIDGAREGLTINTGIIQGGTSTNQVPDTCVVKFNVRIRHPEDADWCLTQLENVQLAMNQINGFSASLHGSFTRMPKALDDAHIELFSLLKECGQQLQLDLKWIPTGGCCDGNNLSNHGLPNIDTLGVRGGFIHSPDEFICLDSLNERAKLSALMLITLAHDGLPSGLAEREIQR